MESYRKRIKHQIEKYIEDNTKKFPNHKRFIEQLEYYLEDAGCDYLHDQKNAGFRYLMKKAHTKKRKEVYELLNQMTDYEDKIANDFWIIKNKAKNENCSFIDQLLLLEIYVSCIACIKIHEELLNKTKEIEAEANVAEKLTNSELSEVSLSVWELSSICSNEVHRYNIVWHIFEFQMQPTMINDRYNQADFYYNREYRDYADLDLGLDSDFDM